jgi:hypothetical protein
LKSAFAAALIVDEKGIAVAQQDVAGLEVAVEKVISRGAEEKFGEAVKIVFEGLLVEGDAGEAEEIVFEIVEIPGDGLAIEAGVWIADAVVEVAGGFDLEAREDRDYFAIGFNHLGSNALAGAVLGEELEERGVAEIFFEISAMGEVFGVDFGNGEAVTAKVFGEFEKGGVFFADAVENADGTEFCVGEANDFTAGSAELALEREDMLGRNVEMLLEELFENIQGHECPPDSY